VSTLRVPVPGKLHSIAMALQSSGLLSESEANDVIRNASEGGKSMWEIIASNSTLSEQEIAEHVAAHLRISCVKLGNQKFDEEALKAIPQELARKHTAIAYALVPHSRRKTLRVAMADPTDFAAQQELEFVTSCSISPAMATRSEILDAISREYEPDSWMDSFLTGVADADMQIFENAEEETVADEKGIRVPPVVKLLNLVIQQGIREGASDIHLEPTGNHFRVRGRVQGLLKEFLQIPKWLHEPVVSRLKVLAKMDITDRRRPQDGRIKVSFENSEIDLRVSTLPTHFGEKAVLRILGSGQRVPSTTELGLSVGELEIVRRSTDQPQGLVLVTGPTGSGKTTTLYSLLNEKRDPSINIITVEDPIEIQLPGINQVQVNTKAGLTFAASLRSMLRQDPDVILVGEIRDLETAEIAVNASQTGHLVLSTLHTNGTVSTITRLLELGVDPYLASTSLNLIIAQRLLRVLCESCKVEDQPDAVNMIRLGFRKEERIFRSVGCDACNHSGYKGRTGIYELLRMTPHLRELVAKHASEPELRKAALASGLKPLIDCACDVIRKGNTSIEEVLRVVQIEETSECLCPQCRGVIEGDFASCPFCGLALRNHCAGCKQELKPEWKMCPFCGTEVAAVPRSESASRIAVVPRPFEVPTTSVEADAPLERVPRQSPDQPTIIVADDDPIMRSIVCSALTMLPNNPMVKQAENGVEALTLAAQSAVDLLITDINMPEMGGFELCAELRKNVATAFTPVLMLTVNRDEQSRTQGYLVGTDDYMGKPFSIPEFLARVGRLLRRTYGY
jgi:type IV pilus assembly protein PilB